MKLLCVCGHPFETHGDRAMAACVPEEIAFWGTLQSASMGGDLMPFPIHCRCIGWREKAMRDEDLKDIPQSITKPARDKLLTELGMVNLMRVKAPTFTPTTIEAEIIASDDEGDYIVENGEMKVHTIVIPIVADSNESSRSDCGCGEQDCNKCWPEKRPQDV